MRMIIYRKVGTTIIELHGVISPEDAIILKEEFHRLVNEEGHLEVIVDLSKVTYLDISGVKALKSLKDIISKYEGSCKFINPQPKIKNQLDQNRITGLEFTKGTGNLPKIKLGFG